MDANSFIYLISTLFTVSFFNLRILRKISEIQSAYQSSYGDVLRRLEAVEYGLKTLRGSVSAPTPPLDSTVDVNPEMG